MASDSTEWHWIDPLSITTMLQYSIIIRIILNAFDDNIIDQICIILNVTLQK